MLPSALLRARPSASPSIGPNGHAYGPAARRRPTNVVFLIPDGFGPAAAALAREYQRHQGGTAELALDPHQVGSVRTHAADHRITDSAAAATAYATGTKTDNGAVATSPEGRPLGTLLEGARRRGLATGLVVTSRLTHATPAAFSAHTADRAHEDEIARQQIEQGVDVLLGGGRRHFHLAGARADEPSLLRRAEQAGYRVACTAADLEAAGTGPLLGLFADSHMSYEVDRAEPRQPSLAAMTRAALDRLSAREEGFFLLVEGSRIDHAAHDNDPAAQLREVLAFDRAVETVFDAVDQTETLVVGVPDHETGGLTLGRTRDGQATSTWHPSVLDGVTASCTTIAGALRTLRSEHERTSVLRSGTREIIEHYTGVTDLTADELDRLLATPGPRDVAALLNRRAHIGWTTGGHTATDVPLYAAGPGADRFRGHHDNTAIGLMLAALLDVDLAALTDQRRSRTVSP